MVKTYMYLFFHYCYYFFKNALFWLKFRRNYQFLDKNCHLVMFCQSYYNIELQSLPTDTSIVNNINETKMLLLLGNYISGSIRSQHII